MTFNATSLNIARAEKAGFVRVKPVRAPPEQKRTLLVWPSIAEIFATGGLKQEFPHRKADGLIGLYVAGHYLTLSQRSAPDVELEKLENVSEVWALCFREPNPGFRLLGRFIEATALVGFRLYDRHTLNGIPTILP